MVRTVLVRLAGVFLIVYGIAAVLMGWWGYSVTHEAFTSVRNFTAIFEQQRTRALDALQGATGIISGTDSPGSSTGNAPQGLRGHLRGLLGGQSTGQPAPTPAAGATPQPAAGLGLGDRLRGIVGGQPTGQPAPTPAAGAAPEPATGLGLLDDLTSKVTDAHGILGGLGQGPFRPGFLDQVEFATNGVLIWMAVHGLVSFIIGVAMVRWSPRPAAALAYPAGLPPQQPAGSYPNYPPAQPTQAPVQPTGYWQPGGGQEPPTRRA